MCPGLADVIPMFWYDRTERRQAEADGLLREACHGRGPHARPDSVRAPDVDLAHPLGAIRLLPSESPPSAHQSRFRELSHGAIGSGCKSSKYARRASSSCMTSLGSPCRLPRRSTSSS
jgi:hypothetical protein